MADTDIINTAEYTGIDVQEFVAADFVGGLDLVAAGNVGKAPREIWVIEVGGGNLTVRTKYGTRQLSGALLESKNIPITCAVFEVLEASDVARILVIW